MRIRRKNEWMTFNNDEGLTKREYFAGLAMQGLLASPLKLNNSSDKKDDDIVRASINLAEKLIAELDKNEP